MSKDSTIPDIANMVTFVLDIYSFKIIMTKKTTQIIAIVLMVIPALVLFTGGTMKLIEAEPETVVQFLNKAGFGAYMRLLGVASILIAVLILYPQTNKIGFLLASCYFAAALSLEISAAQLPVSALFLTILWIGMFFKNKEMFLPVSEKNT